MAGIWTLKGGTLNVQWFDKKKAPESEAVACEVARLAQILGRRIGLDG